MGREDGRAILRRALRITAFGAVLAYCLPTLIGVTASLVHAVVFVLVLGVIGWAFILLSLIDRIA